MKNRFSPQRRTFNFRGSCVSSNEIHETLQIEKENVLCLPSHIKQALPLLARRHLQVTWLRKSQLRSRFHKCLLSSGTSR